MTFLVVIFPEKCAGTWIMDYEKDKIDNRPIEPVVRHPKKKIQEELWAFV